MFEKSVIRATGQWWKALLACAAILGGGALILGGVVQMQAPDTSSIAMVLAIAGVFLGGFGLLFACVAICCPTCKARWVQQAIKEQKAGQWLVWLVSQSECPACKGPSDGRFVGGEMHH